MVHILNGVGKVMTPNEVQRKLTAILCADVEGYSHLMDDDEAPPSAL